MDTAQTLLPLGEALAPWGVVRIDSHLAAVHRPEHRSTARASPRPIHPDAGSHFGKCDHTAATLAPSLPTLITLITLSPNVPFASPSLRAWAQPVKRPALLIGPQTDGLKPMSWAAAPSARSINEETAASTSINPPQHPATPSETRPDHTFQSVIVRTQPPHPKRPHLPTGAIPRAMQSTQRNTHRPIMELPASTAGTITLSKV